MISSCRRKIKENCLIDKKRSSCKPWRKVWKMKSKNSAKIPWIRSGLATVRTSTYTTWLMKPHNAVKTSATISSKKLPSQTKPPYPTKSRTQTCANQISENKPVTTTDNNLRKEISENELKWLKILWMRRKSLDISTKYCSKRIAKNH